VGYVIGCDIGSQSAKAVLLDPDGKTVVTATAPYEMIHLHNGWADQDPAAYRKAIIYSIRQVMAESGVAPSEVTHLGFSSQVDGVVPIDAQNCALRNAIIWLDRRGTEQVDRLDRAVGADRLFAVTGLNLDASHTAPKIMWLADHEPEVYRSAASLPSVGGYAVAWLTGRSIQDHANSSSTLLYDVARRDWSDELLDAAGIDRRLMPEIGAAHDVAGELLPEVAAELGLTTNCLVVVSTGDDHAACLGAGGVSAGVVVDILGTAEPVGVASDTPVFDETKLVETHAHAVDGKFLIENPGFVSGGNTLWLAKNILGVSQAELFALAATSEPGSHGVRFIPALSGAMAPRWNDRMRGSFTGLGMNHNSSDLARSVIEANVFAFRDIFNRLKTLGLADSLRVVGGGSRSQLWLQAKATLCDIEISRVTSNETSAVGAGMLAGVAAGTFVDFDDAVKRCVQLDPVTISPIEADRECLNEAYEDYRSVYEALEPHYDKKK